MTRLGLGLVLLCGQAAATTCPSQFLIGSDDPLSFAIELSDWIFVGEVTDRWKTVFRPKGSEETVGEVRATFEVKEVLKGEVPSVVHLKSADFCDCMYDFEPGVEYIVLAARVENYAVPKFCRYIEQTSNSLLVEIRKRLVQDD